MSPFDSRKWLLLLFSAVIALRVLGAWQAPLLSGEAYYWLWGQHPDWGYYDHPPMVAWEAAALGNWAAPSPLAARAGAILFGALGALAFWWMARGFFPEGRTAARATALFLVIPIFHLNGIVLMPDNGLILFMTLAWGAFWRAAEKGRRGEGAAQGLWLLAGAAGGAALLSKFHAWVMLPPLWAFLALSPGHRRLLRAPGPWLAATAALLVLSPNLEWNAQREWLNYAYQWRRSDLPESAFTWSDPGIFLAGFLLTLTPLVAGAVVWAAGRSAAAWLKHARAEGRDARALFLLCAGAPLPLFLGTLSFGVTISMHWPAAGYVPLVLLMVGMLEGKKDVIYRGLFGTALAATLLMHVGTAALPHLPMEWPYIARAQAKSAGWPELGARVRALHADLDAANGAAPAVIMGKSWHSASLLAFYSGRPQDTFVYVEADAHNFRLWMERRGGLEGADAVAVLEYTSQKNFATLQRKYQDEIHYFESMFDTVMFVESLTIYQDGEVAPLLTLNPTRPVWREFHIFECRGFRGELAARLP